MRCLIEYPIEGFESDVGEAVCGPQAAPPDSCPASVAPRLLRCAGLIAEGA